MPQCACITRNGVQCQHRASPGKSYCGHHIACANPATEASAMDTARAQASAARSGIDALLQHANDLARERDFYYAKLLRIEGIIAREANDAAVRRRVAAALVARAP